MESSEQQQDSAFVETMLPCVNVAAYTWIRVQAMRRDKRRIGKTDRPLPDKHPERYRDGPLLDRSQERISRLAIDDVELREKKNWASRLLSKLRKDIVPGDRDHFMRSVMGTLANGEKPRCVLTNGDGRAKMRRIDCFRQSNKVWRLDLVTLVLFCGIPLESTDGERLGKTCNLDLCIQPHHLYIIVREVDLLLAKLLGE